MSASAYISAFREAPLALYPLGAGLLITSSMFFGNVGLSLTGPLPIIREQLGVSTLSSKQKVRVWRLFYDAATPYIVGGTLLATALHGGAAYLAHIARPNSPLAFKLAAASAVCSIIALPFTLAFIMPINQGLIALDEKTAFSKTESKQAKQLIQKWDVRHKYRFLMYGAGWLLGLAALGVSLKEL